MNEKVERFVIVSFTPITETYFVVHLKMSRGNEKHGIMGIKAATVETTGDTITITDGVNRPAGVHLSAELSRSNNTGWVAYR